MAGPLVDLGGFFTVTTMTCSATVSAIIGNTESYDMMTHIEPHMNLNIVFILRNRLSVSTCC